MLEVADLELVRAVAENGSLTRAAIELHTTQSALSHRLATMEDKLGTMLFERLGRTMRPTPAGAKLILESGAILDLLSQATTNVVREGKNSSSVLRLATQCYTCYSWLPPVLTRFKRTFPNVRVDIILDATYRATAALLEGGLDVGVVAGPVRGRRLTSEPLFDDELVVVMRPGHPLSKRTWVDAQDLAGENLITYDFPLEQTALYRQVFKPSRLIPESILRVPLTEAIIEMVKAGLGVSVLAQWAIDAHLQTRSVCAKPITNSGLHREWHVATLRAGSKRPHLIQFIQLLRSHMRKGAPVPRHNSIRH